MKLMKQLLVAGLFTVLGVGTANAGTILQCSTAKGKQISLTKNGSTFIYKFGKNLNTPEIQLKRAASAVDVQFFNSRDRQFYEIALQNGAYSYVVAVEGNNSRLNGVTVLKNGQAITTVNCAGKSMANTSGL